MRQCLNRAENATESEREKAKEVILSLEREHGQIGNEALSRRIDGLFDEYGEGVASVVISIFVIPKMDNRFTRTL